MSAVKKFFIYAFLLSTDQLIFQIIFSVADSRQLKKTKRKKKFAHYFLSPSYLFDLIDSICVKMMSVSPDKMTLRTRGALVYSKV